jgi:oxaloacetate decarboxylase beta subunit
MKMILSALIVAAAVILPPAARADQADAAAAPGAVQTRRDIPSLSSRITTIWMETGIYGFLAAEPRTPAAPVVVDSATYQAEVAAEHKPGVMPYGLSQGVMIVVCLVLIYLAIIKGFEPLLLLPIGFGGLLANIPNAGITAAPVMKMVIDAATGACTPVMLEPGGFLYYIFNMGVSTGVFPLLIFMGVGAMTDFGPLIANPKTALLGGAAQFGIFFALLGALVLNDIVPGINFSIRDAASIGIIGGADGPTAIWLTTKLSPNLLGAIAVAAYSYMALVPIIQPPIMKLCTTEADRKIVMKQLRPVKRIEKVAFPLIVTLLCALLLPSASPLVGALMLGNLARECGVVERLSDTMANSLINIVTILLGLAVGSKLASDKFLTLETLGIILLGLFAFAVGTAGGVLMARLMNPFLKDKINPLIGSAGVSAVPMSARVSNKVGLESDSSNYLLMHAMGPNVSGVIGSAVAAGVLYRLCDVL